MCILCDKIERLENIVLSITNENYVLKKELHEAHYFLEKMNPKTYEKVRKDKAKAPKAQEHEEDCHLHVVKDEESQKDAKRGFPHLDTSNRGEDDRMGDKMEKMGFISISSPEDLKNANLPADVKKKIAETLDTLDKEFNQD